MRKLLFHAFIKKNIVKHYRQLKREQQIVHNTVFCLYSSVFCSYSSVFCLYGSVCGFYILLNLIKNFSLDIEGGEFQVLRTIPWEKVSIGLFLKSDVQILLGEIGANIIS